MEVADFGGLIEYDLLCLLDEVAEVVLNRIHFGFREPEYFVHVGHKLLKDLLTAVSRSLLLFYLPFELGLVFLQPDVLCLHTIQLHPLLIQVLSLRLRVLRHHKLHVLGAHLLLLLQKLLVLLLK